MKKLLGFLVVLVLIWSASLSGCLLNPHPFSSSSPTPLVTPTPTASPTPLDPPPVQGENIVHYDGDPNPSGSMGVATFADCLVYFNTAKLRSYIGCYLTGVAIYYPNNEGWPTGTLPYTVKIYDGVGGTATTPGTLRYSQENAIFTENAWNTAFLNNPILITEGLVIWAGFSLTWSNASGVWPISTDYLPEVPKTSYYKNDVFPTTWTEYPHNYNIRLVVTKN